MLLEKMLVEIKFTAGENRWKFKFIRLIATPEFFWNQIWSSGVSISCTTIWCFGVDEKRNIIVKMIRREYKMKNEAEKFELWEMKFIMKEWWVIVKWDEDQEISLKDWERLYRRRNSWFSSQRIVPRLPWKLTFWNIDWEIGFPLEKIEAKGDEVGSEIWKPLYKNFRMLSIYRKV